MEDTNKPMPEDNNSSTPPKDSGDGSVAFNLSGDQPKEATPETPKETILEEPASFNMLGDKEKQEIKPELAEVTAEADLAIADLNTDTSTQITDETAEPKGFSKRMKIMIAALVSLFLLAATVIVFLLGGTDLFQGSLNFVSNKAADAETVNRYASWTIDSELPITDSTKSLEATLSLQAFPKKASVPYRVVLSTDEECYADYNKSPDDTICDITIIEEGQVEITDDGTATKMISADLSKIINDWQPASMSTYKFIAEVDYSSLELSTIETQSSISKIFGIGSPKLELTTEQEPAATNLKEGKLKLIQNTETFDKYSIDVGSPFPGLDQTGTTATLSVESDEALRIGDFKVTGDTAQNISELTTQEPAAVMPIFEQFTDQEPADALQVFEQVTDLEPAELVQFDTNSLLVDPALLDGRITGQVLPIADSTELALLANYFTDNCSDKDITDGTTDAIDMLINNLDTFQSIESIIEVRLSDIELYGAFNVIFSRDQFIDNDDKFIYTDFLAALTVKHTEYVELCHKEIASINPLNLFSRFAKANFLDLDAFNLAINNTLWLNIDEGRNRFVLIRDVVFDIQQPESFALDEATADLEVILIDENYTPDASRYIFNAAHDAEPDTVLNEGDTAQVMFDQRINLPNISRGHFDLCIYDVNDLVDNNEDYNFVLDERTAAKLDFPPADDPQEHLCLTKGENYILNTDNTGSSWSRRVNGLLRNGHDATEGLPYPMQAHTNYEMPRLPLGEYEVRLTVYDIQYKDPVDNRLKHYEDGFEVTAADRFVVAEAPQTPEETVTLVAEPGVLQELVDYSAGDLEPLTLLLTGGTFTDNYNFSASDFTFTSEDGGRIVPMSDITVTRNSDTEIVLDIKAIQHEPDNSNIVRVRLKAEAFSGDVSIDSEDPVKLVFYDKGRIAPGPADVDPTATVEIDRNRLTDDPTEPQNNGPITANYQMTLPFENLINAKVSLCIYENDAAAIVPLLCLQDDENVNLLEINELQQFTYIAEDDNTLTLVERQITLADFTGLPDDTYKVGLSVQDVVYGNNESFAGPVIAAIEPTFVVERIPDPLPDDPDEPQEPAEQDPAIELLVTPRSINVEAPGQSIYDFQVTNTAAQTALIDLFLYEDNIEEPLVYIQSNKTLELDNGSYSTSDPNNVSANSVSQRRVYGTNTNTVTGIALIAGDYNVALVVKQVDGITLAEPLSDTAAVAIADIVVVGDPPVDNTPIIVTSPPIVTAPTTPIITPQEQDQIATLPSSSGDRIVSPSRPDAQAMLSASPGVAGNTGPGLLIYPFMAGGSYLLARRRKKKVRS